MLSEKIKEIRKKNYLNQSAFAKMIGVTQSAVSQWENDLTRPNSYQLEAIASSFNISIDELLADNINEEKPSAPKTPEARIVSGGMDKLPKEQREQILNVVRAMFSNNPELFKKGEDDVS